MTVLHLVGLLEVRRRRDVGPRVMVGIGGWGEGGFNAVYYRLHATLSVVEKYDIARTECTTKVTSARPHCLAAHRHCLEEQGHSRPFSLKARTIAGDGIEGGVSTSCETCESTRQAFSG